MMKSHTAASLLAAFFFLWYPHPALGADGYTTYTAVRAIQKSESVSTTRWMEVPGRGPMIYYAQNNPVWNDMRYEARNSLTHRRFGDGGCGPTSVASAIANLLPMEDLGKIRLHAARRAGEYGISLASMNPLNTGSHVGIYWLATAEEYLTYFPLVCGQYAAGNNPKLTVWRARPRQENVSAGGTKIEFMVDLCAIYGLTHTLYTGKSNMEWLDAIRCGGTAVALANTSNQPFVNGPGHYVTVVGCDESYLYIMDPQNKTQAQYRSSDKNKVLEVLGDGLIRVRYEDYGELRFSRVHTVTTQEMESQLAQMRNATP